MKLLLSARHTDKLGPFNHEDPSTNLTEPSVRLIA